MEEHTSGSGMSPWAERPVADWSGRFLRGSILPDSGEPWVINGIKEEGCTRAAADAATSQGPATHPSPASGPARSGQKQRRVRLCGVAHVYQPRARERSEVVR